MNTQYLLPTHWPSLKELEDGAQIIPEIDPLGVFVLNELLDAARTLESAIDADLRRYGISFSRYATIWAVVRLHNLEGTDGVTPAELAEFLGVTRATITGLLDGLERDKYIKRRRRSNDRRKIDIVPAEHAVDLLAEIYPDHIARLGKVTSHLSEREKKQLYKLLEKVATGTPALLENGGTSSDSPSKQIIRELVGGRAPGSRKGKRTAKG